MNISIVIPCYNEANGLEKNIKKVVSFVKKYNYELILVNDASTDNTLEIIKKLAKKNKKIKIVDLKHKEKGNTKGLAVKAGMLKTKYSLALFTDADQSTPIWQLDRFVKLLDDYDVVIGSRTIAGANVKIHQPFFREMMGKVFNKIVRILTVKGIIDTQCGFKLFKNPKRIFKKQLLKGWAFDVELLFIAQKLGLKIKEQPITWIDNPASRISPIKSAIEMFLQVLNVFFNNILGRYK